MKLENTSRINREELLGLLNTMMPPEQQLITVRARISDVEAELARQLSATGTPPTGLPACETPKPVPLDAAQARIARKAAKAAKKATRKAAAAKRAAKAQSEANPEAAMRQAQSSAASGAADNRELVLPHSVCNLASNGIPRLFDDVDWNELLTAAVSAMITPTTTQTVRPPSDRSEPQGECLQVAALLPMSKATRFPRATTPPPIGRSRTQSDAPTDNAAVQHQATQRVVDRSAPLESAEHAAFPMLSAGVVAQLSGDEIAMLPIELRRMLPEVPRWPRIEKAPAPEADFVDIHSAPCTQLGHSVQISTRMRAADSMRLATIIASFAATFLVGLCAVYFLL